MPLIVIDPEDLQRALSWLAVSVAALGFAAAMLFSMLNEIGRGIASLLRKTEWWHRRKANEAFRLANSTCFLDRLPPTKREKVHQRLVREAFEHGYTADAIAAQRRARREAKAPTT